MKKCSLYIHVPFCVKKCIYCDFYSLPEQDTQSYESALAESVRIFAKKYPQRNITSVYFGGGTPNFLSVNSLEKLLDIIGTSFDLSPDCEITCEINPELSKKNDLEDLKAAGFNRLSIGVQSLINEELKFLGRIHSAETAAACIKNARNIFDNLSLDLISDIPGQSLDSLEYSLKNFMNYFPDHVSVYSLTCEAGTPLHSLVENGNITLNSQETDLAHTLFVRDFLVNSGYEHYEISNYCRPGKGSRHNSAYWLNQDYLGLGPSAWSRMDGQRCAFEPSLEKFIAAHSDFHIREAVEPLDELITSLRIKSGLERSRCPENLWNRTLIYAAEHPRWFITGENRIACTEEGWLFLDTILLDLTP